MTDWQSPEEIAAHLGPEGPVEAVRQWLDEILLTGRFEVAWGMTDSAFQRDLVAAWVNAHRQHPVVVACGDPDEAVVELLLADGPAHPLWTLFMDAQLAEMRRAWADYDPATWGAGSRPRVVGPDLEIVLLVPVPSDEPVLITQPTFMRAMAFHVRRVGEGWRIAGFPPGIDQAEE